MARPVDFVITEHPGAVAFDVRAAPRSSRNCVLGVHDGALKIALTAPPVDGEANVCIVAFVAKSLGVPKSHVSIVRGERGRQKTIRVAGVTCEAVRAWVSAASPLPNGGLDA